MDKLPTDAVVAIDRAGISSGDAMTHGADAAELFDIEMDELARFFAFITPDRFGRLQGTKLVVWRAILGLSHRHASTVHSSLTCGFAPKATECCVAAN